MTEKMKEVSKMKEDDFISAVFGSELSALNQKDKAEIEAELKRDDDGTPISRLFSAVSAVMACTAVKCGDRMENAPFVRLTKDMKDRAYFSVGQLDEYFTLFPKLNQYVFFSSCLERFSYLIGRSLGKPAVASSDNQIHAYLDALEGVKVRFDSCLNEYQGKACDYE